LSKDFIELFFLYFKICASKHRGHKSTAYIQGETKWEMLTGIATLNQMPLWVYFQLFIL